MNCEQFENRIQHLLDERATLSLDLQIQQHARDCMDCRNALNVYECFGAPSDESHDESRSVMVASAVKSDIRGKVDSTTWKARQRQQSLNRFFVAAAALLLVSFILVSNPNSPPSVVQLDTSDVDHQAGIEIGPANQFSMIDSLGLSNFVSNTWSTGREWTGSLTETAYVDLSSIGRIDLVSLIPAESARAVQGIPASFESIEPIYRYSTDLPVLNQWSSGINYTIGLIQSSLRQPESNRGVKSDDDLGNRASDFNCDVC